MSDNYEFAKSTTPQSIQLESPYEDKQYNYINDINSGVYQSSGLTLVTFDLTNIYRSDLLLDSSQMYAVIPLIYTNAYTTSNTAGTLIAPTANNMWSLALKAGYWNLINSCELVIDGKTIDQVQSFTNNYINFKMLSQMSQDDLRSFGDVIGLGDKIDNCNSLKFNPSASCTGTGTATAFPSVATNTGISCSGGNGVSNNLSFGNQISYSPVLTVAVATGTTAATTTLAAGLVGITAGQLVTGAGIVASNVLVVSYVSATGVLTMSQSVTTTTGAFITLSNPNFSTNQGDQLQPILQGTGVYNPSIYSRQKKFFDATNATTNGLIGASGIMTADQLKTEFTPRYSVQNTNYGVWEDYAIIRMCDIFDSMKNMPLTKKFSATIRFYINTGTTAVILQQQYPNSNFSLVTSGSTSSFTNCCPLIVPALPSTVYPAASTGMAIGLFVGKTQSSSLLGGVNFSNANYSNPMNSCRMYYPQVKLKVERLIPYINENRNKKVVYTSFLTNQYSNIGSSSSFSQLVQSGVTGLRGVLIIPYVANTVNGLVAASLFSSGVTSFSQYLSPFDSAPVTTAPISLINLNVAVGGRQMLNSNLAYSWENFLEQVSLYEKVNQSDIGISCGLISRDWWQNSRYYYVDCTRGSVADSLESRNINIQFTNNSNVAIDIIVITEYYSSFIVDVETGAITK